MISNLKVNNIKLYFSFLLLIGLFLSCRTEDTCNSKQGDTFEDISFKSSKFVEDSCFEINISAKTLGILPNEYFENFVLIKRETDLFGNTIQNSWEAIKDIKVDKSKIEMVILQDSLPPIGEQNKLYFHLKFPDRINYIDCSHPGSSDIYLLDLAMNLKRELSDSIYLSKFAWEEKLIKGGF